MTEQLSEPLGHTVSNYYLLGVEHNQQRRWVAADMELIVHPLGRFFVHVVTKQQYQAEGMLRALETADIPQEVLEQKMHQSVEPFVVNDEALSADVLDRKFRNRVIEKDLAESLQYSGPVDED